MMIIKFGREGDASEFGLRLERFANRSLTELGLFNKALNDGALGDVCARSANADDPVESVRPVLSRCASRPDVISAERNATG